MKVIVAAGREVVMGMGGVVESGCVGDCCIVVTEIFGVDEEMESVNRTMMI